MVAGQSDRDKVSGSSRNGWHGVSKAEPCPRCGKSSWCQISPDGVLLMCRHESTGAHKTGQDSNGAPYYLHRLTHGLRRPPAPHSETVPERADPDTLHVVYSALLRSLPLSGHWQQNLQRRGLSDQDIQRNGYKTLPVQGRHAIACQLHERFGETLLRVPGFGFKKGDSEPYLTIFGPAGLLVPVRDQAGRIVALKVRLADPGRGPKYVYISSTEPKGPGPGSPVHVPAGIHAPAEMVRLTEGELKADVAFALTALPTISAPGVGNWQPCLEVLKALGAKAVRLAFDADAKSNLGVARPLLACAEALAAEGYSVELESWDGVGGKGIDDVLAAGRVAEVVGGQAALEAIRAITRPHFWELWPGAAAIEGEAARIVVCLGWGAADAAMTLQKAGLPAGSFGVTAKENGVPPVSLAAFAKGKTVCLLRLSAGSPDVEQSNRLAHMFLRAGAAEVRQDFLGWGFPGTAPSPDDVTRILDQARPVTPAPGEAVGGRPGGDAGLSEAEKAAALDRLAATLEGGGAEALFRDAALLRTLAQLSLGNPAEFAAARAVVKEHKVSVRDLDRALRPILEQLRSSQPAAPATEDAPDYPVEHGCICRKKHTAEGGVIILPLCNFDARIVEQVVHDDGAEQLRLLAVEGRLNNGAPLPRAEVPAADFPRMDWPVSAWGTRAVVYAGQGTKDHLRCALQLLSKDAPLRTIYGHTGWRKVGDGWAYLHAGGAIGADGLPCDVAVTLPQALAAFHLPDPPAGAELTEAIRSSLHLLTLGPDRLLFPLLAAVYRSVLGGTDFSLHLAGLTGTCKTEAAALAQQHFGAGLDARHLPGSWASTGNSIEGLAFAAKDALLVVDDFCPVGSTADVQRYHREADRLFRAQGNAAGRARMRADATLRPSRPPRGMILSTGEDVPRGQSLRARLLVLEFSPSDIDRKRLTPYQSDAATGKYAAALAGFVRWLAPQYEAIRGRLKAEAAELRDRATAAGQHARTPGIVADLALGLKYLLAFALEAGAVTVAEVEDLKRRAWLALQQAAADQAQHVRDADPATQFLGLLAAALASGRAHVAGSAGLEPTSPEAWGWRGKELHYRGEGGTPETDLAYAPQGRRIGWLDGRHLYLEPEAAFAEAQELARQKGEALPIAARTLWKRLREKDLLAGWDERRQRNTVRRTLEGVKDREVLHLQADVLSTARPSEPSASSNGGLETERNADGFCGRLGGRSDGAQEETSAGTVRRNGEEQVETVACGRFGRSDTGGEIQQVGSNLPNGGDWGEV